MEQLVPYFPLIHLAVALAGLWWLGQGREGKLFSTVPSRILAVLAGIACEIFAASILIPDKFWSDLIIVLSTMAVFACALFSWATNTSRSN